MSKPTFDMLFQRLSTFLSYDGHRRRVASAIPLQMRVGVALWWLATGVGYRTLAHLFGICSALVCLIINEFCRAMRDELWCSPSFHSWVSFRTSLEVSKPTGDSLSALGLSMEATYRSSLHLRTTLTTLNRKGWHSVILQAVGDHRFCFTNINVGWPGNVHDSRVLRNSDIYDKAERGVLFPNITDDVQAHRCPSCCWEIRPTHFDHGS